jgi:hypothetical protein
MPVPCHLEWQGFADLSGVLRWSDNILHRQLVGLMYDAVFGPDVADVSAWKQIAIEFVDYEKG